MAEWPRLAEAGVLTGYQPGQGHVGPSLMGIETHFPTAAGQEDFIRTGSEVGSGYGNARSGTGGMPGFAARAASAVPSSAFDPELPADEVDALDVTVDVLLELDDALLQHEGRPPSSPLSSIDSTRKT